MYIIPLVNLLFALASCKYNKIARVFYFIEMSYVAIHLLIPNSSMKEYEATNTFSAYLMMNFAFYVDVKLNFAFLFTQLLIVHIWIKNKV